MLKSFQAIFSLGIKNILSRSEVRSSGLSVVKMVYTLVLFSIHGFDTNGCECNHGKQFLLV